MEDLSSDLKSLRRLASAIDPSVVLVEPRLFRRVAGRRRARRATGRGAGVMVTRQRAVSRSKPDELGLNESNNVPLQRLWLVPVDRDWSDPRVARRRLWAALLNRAVERALDARCLEGSLSETLVRQRESAIGEAVCREADRVLSEDGRIDVDAPKLQVYRVFVCRYLILRHIEPARLREVFPSIVDTDRVDSALLADLDGGELAERTRPVGAEPDLAPVEDEKETHEWIDTLTSNPDPPRLSPGPNRLLAKAAELARARGNDVRAAILWCRAARDETRSRAGQHEAKARESIESLAARLTRALEAEPGEVTAWRRALEPLLQPATKGLRGGAARVLFSLQNACVDLEKPQARIALFDWITSFGTMPLRRPTPILGLVQRQHHLRQAIQRLGRVAIDDSERTVLADRLHHASDHAEDSLRRALRPRIAAALDHAGLRPSNVPEAVGHSKLIEELIDRIASRGFVTASELRDELARNPLKLPDLSADALINGDRLIQLDRTLAEELEGVYRRAEIYLRLLQKGSSLAFGTWLGRWLTLNLVLPFGGAFIVLEGLQHLVEPIVNLTAGPGPLASRTAEIMLNAGTIGAASVPAFQEPIATAIHAYESHHVHVMTRVNVLALGVVLLALIRWSRFRSLMTRVVVTAGRGFWAIAVDLPRWLRQQPWMIAFLSNRWTRGAWRWAIKPAIPALLAMGIARVFGVDSLRIGLMTFGGFLAIANSRVGRWFEEEVTEAAGRAWVWLGRDFFPGLIRAILQFFRLAVEWVDQMLYAVDEFLRFRSGESRLIVGLKAVFGLLWSAVRYVVRMVVNLLIEPQINPIKHFPVVTVAHKVTLPFVLALPPVLMSPPLGLAQDTALGFAFFLQLLVPGVFGFLVWELKENWKLYASNRPRTLRRTLVGSHGETVVRLLRRGFHSGTLPRTFRKLRKAARPGRDTLRRWSRHHMREELHHVERDVRRFLERDLLELLRRSRTLSDIPLKVGEIRLSTIAIRAEIERSDFADHPLVITFVEEDGWLAARLGEPLPNWVESLEESPRSALGNALAGLYARAGVEVACEQVRDELGSDFTLTGEGLETWPSDDSTMRVPIDLREASMVSDTVSGNSMLASRLLFPRDGISWSTWVDAWEREQSGSGEVPRVVVPDVLPGEPATHS